MANDQMLQLVTFKLGSEEFGVEIRKVQEINRMIGIARMPGSPPFVEGVVNLRGRIIPVMNLRTRLGFGDAEHGKETRIIVVEIGGSVIGFIVDSVREVLRISDANLEQAPELATGADARYIQGVIRLEDRILIFLDLDIVAHDASGALVTAA